MARIVFDLDGTLIDSAPDIHAGANGLLADEGLPPLTPEQTRSFVGNGAAVFIARMRAVRGIPDGEQDRLYAEFTRRYETFVGLTKVYPGVVDALRDLAAAGHVLGICTNKPIRPTQVVLKHLKLSGFFDTVWGGDSLPVHKPDPAPLHAAFDALGQGARLFVGDSGVDAETAQNLQVPFMLFTEGYRREPVENLPHSVAFDDFSALPGLVEAQLRS